eukprot:snap_masked-scaffold_9-processed-gene-5.19-mRNA-1 protein AED:1.00 eAED:1.00 QI:0/-1/0/0/-1/1/1/0/190
MKSLLNLLLGSLTFIGSEGLPTKATGKSLDLGIPGMILNPDEPAPDSNLREVTASSSDGRNIQDVSVFMKYTNLGDKLCLNTEPFLIGQNVITKECDTDSFVWSYDEISRLLKFNNVGCVKVEEPVQPNSNVMVYPCEDSVPDRWIYKDNTFYLVSVETFVLTSVPENGGGNVVVSTFQDLPTQKWMAME